MKLSIETFALRERFGNESAIRAIAEAGFDAADFTFYLTSPEKDVLGEAYRSHAEALCAMFQNAGIVCNQTHAPFEYTGGFPLERSDLRFVRLLRSIEMSAMLGAEQIIVHRPLVPPGEDAREYGLRFYSALRPAAEQFGIRIGIENINEAVGGRLCTIFGTPALLCDMVRTLGDDCFTACVDIGHTTYAGTPGPSDFLSGMDRRLLGALHVHDNDHRADQHLFPWQGDTDWDSVTAALGALDYRGDLTLEVFGSVQRYPDALIPEALRHAAALGRRLIAMIEARRMPASI